MEGNVLQMGQAPQFGAMPVTIGIPGGFHFMPEYTAGDDDTEGTAAGRNDTQLCCGVSRWFGSKRRQKSIVVASSEV